MRALPLLLLLGACGGTADDGAAPALVDSPGARLGDPAVSAAINAPIMVDPGLSQTANADAIRPPGQPDPLAVPPDTLGMAADPVDPAALRHAPAPGACRECRVARSSLTLGALATARNAGCAGTVTYASAWANRLPAATPIYPDARLVEAAGSDAPACPLRAVAFASQATLGTVIDWYFTRATGRVRHEADGPLHMLAAADRVLYATARPDGGTDAILLVRS